MATPPPAPTTAAQFLAALVRNGYLPQELPPAITTRNFADFCKSDYAYLNSQKGLLLKSNTQFCIYSAPNQKSGRRSFAIVHPLGQLAVSIAITEHKSEIINLLSKSKVSLYQTDGDLLNERAFKGLDFKKWNTLKAKVQSEYPFILSADISSFFYTIYTHSIPWAAIGKEQVKEWNNHDKAKLAAHWSNDFDKAIQCCQSRETFGIPVGPDTSRIIAEIILAGIESDQALKQWLTNRLAFRLVDDLTIGFENEDEARKALGALRTALWKFNLRLNDDKTRIVSSRESLKERWEIEHDAFALSNINPEQQSEDILRFLDLTLHQCAESGTDVPAFRTCQRLGRLTNTADNFALILDALFHLSREFPRCIMHVTTFLINNKETCRRKPYLDRIKKWVHSTLGAHSAHGHDYEIGWCLVACGALNIKIKKNDLGTGKTLPGPVSLALLGLLRERGLLSVPLSNWAWKAEFKNSGIDGPYWLFFYESVRRRWTKDRAVVHAAKANQVLERMLRKKVTFLEKRIFDAQSINTASRKFIPARTTTAPKSGRPSQSSGRTRARPKASTFSDIVLAAEDFDY